MKKLSKDFFIALLIRAIWTMAETALGMITVGATLTEINWVNVASVSAVAGIYSVVKSFAVGLPEIAPEIKPEDMT